MNKDAQILTGAELDTLVSIVENGPLSIGDLPSKVGMAGLLELGFIAEVVMNQNYWYYAATPKGLARYLYEYRENSITNAIVVRKMRQK